MIPPESLKLRVLAAAGRHAVPPRSSRLLPTVVLAAGAAGAMLVLLQLWGGAAHADGRPAPVGTWIIAGTLVLAAAATWLALPPRRSMLSRPRSQLIAAAIGVPVLLGFWLIGWHGTYDDPFVRDGFRCFALTVASAPWPFLAILHAGRRLEPRQPGLAGAALGAAAGAWAAVTVELWCPLALPGHVLVGHVLPLLLLVLAGAAVGVRLFRLRRVA